MQRFQINHTILLGNNQIIPLLFVTQVEILNMHARHVVAIPFRVLDGSQRRMMVRGKYNIEGFEFADQRLRCCWQAIFEGG